MHFRLGGAGKCDGMSERGPRQPEVVLKIQLTKYSQNIELKNSNKNKILSSSGNLNLEVEIAPVTMRATA